MMKNRFSILTFGLIAVVAVSACTPTVTKVPIVLTEVVTIPATSKPANTATAGADSVAASTPVPVTEVLPVVTSRGPNLEATDPTTVALASDGLQLVEFFRFT